MASNTAAWLTEAKSHPFQVKEAPIWKPAENEILIRNHAVAVNPVDGSLQTRAWWPLNYPTILGHDVAGEVVEIGPNVTRFKPGDRVLGDAVGMATKRNQDNAFQIYTILRTNMASEIPDDVSYERAAVIPLGLSTAAAGLFQREFLGLKLPIAEPTPAPASEAGVLLVWGGASSVGSNAIQLAVAAGYEVLTTASPRNFDYVTKLGASQAFDYSGSNVVEDLLAALEGKTLVGALDCIGLAATTLTVEVVRGAEGRKFVTTTKPGFKGAEGVTVKNVFATAIKDNEVGRAIYEDFLPGALRAKSFVPAPEPLVAGQGLGSIQAAVDLHARGVSAQKIVVSL